MAKRAELSEEGRALKNEEERDRFRKCLPCEEECTRLSELFKAFGDSTRIRILHLLSLEEICVNDLADVLELTPSAISHQLRLLKQNRLVKSRREGKLMYYSLDDDHVRSMIAQAMEHIQE
ncbi:MAG: winged helix-turn-helix transcriptional regulator [Lachnospiraceae bacterium]|nr:winged helix-turn-helix transcriptional regulator [Lachnospiraceae bacterium]